MPYKDPAEQRAALRRWRAKKENALKEKSYPVDVAAKAAANLKWNQRNPEVMRAIAVRYRARKVSAPGTCSDTQLRARVSMFGSFCYVCRGPYQAIDHVIPLSKGGSNWPSNLRPICKSCNSRKLNGDWRRWVCPSH